MINLKKVNRKFQLASGDIEAVKNVNLSIKKGEFVIISGPSGAGKTTLLNMVSGIDLPSSGQVLLNKKPISKFSKRQLNKLRRKTIGMVFQAHALMPLLSAYENVELPLRILGMKGKERKEKTEEILEILGLKYRMRHRPYELSGGERQRVSVARALVRKPEILVADEPTSQLDSVNTEIVFEQIKEICQTFDTTVILATHDQRMKKFGDKLFNMRSGELEKSK
ncbi:MAG: macrolide ABC transporter ATP-binding protein [Chloroflexi bacterium]|nr:macrolide ABC transporter ATP-binding protein [Chloroflexota bacterium]